METNLIRIMPVDYFTATLEPIRIQLDRFVVVSVVNGENSAQRFADDRRLTIPFDLEIAAGRRDREGDMVGIQTAQCLWSHSHSGLKSRQYTH